jgi:hypothetical protein
MWNSNSMIAWLLVAAGLPADDLHPPPHGRAPGWHAGLEVARRSAMTATSPRSGPSIPWSTRTSHAPVQFEGCTLSDAR